VFIDPDGDNWMYYELEVTISSHTEMLRAFFLLLAGEDVKRSSTLAGEQASKQASRQLKGGACCSGAQHPITRQQPSLNR
jgi:hypothetical protein